MRRRSSSNSRIIALQEPQDDPAWRLTIAFEVVDVIEPHGEGVVRVVMSYEDINKQPHGSVMNMGKIGMIRLVSQRAPADRRHLGAQEDGAGHNRRDPLMMPVEITTVGLLAVYVILLASYSSTSSSS